MSVLTDDYSFRFGGLARLFGANALERLRSSHVAVIGIGGVGSWAVEALARSGIGKLTLVDLDDVCVTNINRQLHALNGTVGRSKVAVMADRVRLIAPECEVRERTVFFTESTAQELLNEEPDVVLDCIDSLGPKCQLLHSCRERGITVMTSGGAGGKREASQVKVDDLAMTHGDGLLKQVRKCLRREFGWTLNEGTSCGIRAVFSSETPLYPWSDGTTCPKPEPGTLLKLDCSSGFGTASFVTGAFGLALAGEAVKFLAGKKGM